MPIVELPQWSGLRHKASQVTDKMDYNEAAIDLAVQGFEQVTKTLRQIFLDYNFVMRSMMRNACLTTSR